MKNKTLKFNEGKVYLCKRCGKTVDTTHLVFNLGHSWHSHHDPEYVKRLGGRRKGMVVK